MSQKIDMKNKRFDKLLVLHEAQPYIKPSGQKVTMWHCYCDCGNECDVAANKLRSGHTTSCGCHKHELNYKDGMGALRIKRLWTGMKHRCYNSNAQNYENYGGRGIIICQEWLDSFMNFYNWAMANGYSDELTIDRIDVNGNYEPSNCRWITRKEQANNTRSNRILTYKGVSHTVSEWADILGLKQATISSRLHKGWSVERTLTTETKTGKHIDIQSVLKQIGGAE